MVKKCMPAFTLWTVMLVALTAEWMVAAHEFGGVGRGASGAALRFAGDAALILLPFWFLTPRWRWSVLLPVWLLSVWWTANLWYYRFWGDLLSPASFTMAGNVNAVLLKSVRGVWRWIDILFLLIPLAATAVYLFMRRGLRTAPRLPRKMVASCSAFTLVLFIFSQWVYSRGYAKNEYAEYGKRISLAEATRQRVARPAFNRLFLLKLNGLSTYLVRMAGQIWDVRHTTRTLTATERKEVDSFFALTDSLNASAPDSIPADVVNANRRKNVILIIVESLNSEVLGLRIGGRSVTPVLDSLLNASGTLAATRVVGQVNEGGSGDGQMLYNAGLLPLQGGSAAISVGSEHPFHSLPRRFAGSRIAVMADDAGSWNERETFLNYGYSELRTNLDRPGESARLGSDAVMFDQAIDRINGIREPFMLCMVSMSMHIPFRDPGVPAAPWIESARQFGSSRRNYLRMTHYFDAELGRFIGRLRALGIADNTILVVAADHSQNVESEGASEKDFHYIPVIISGCGITRRIGRTVGEVDVYTTLLALTGRWRAGAYNGLGRIITDPDLSGATDPFMHFHGAATSAERRRQSEAYRVSDLILRSGYYPAAKR